MNMIEQGAVRIPGTISAVRYVLLPLPPQPPSSTVELGREVGIQTVGSDLEKLWLCFIQVCKLQYVQADNLTG